MILCIVKLLVPVMMVCTNNLTIIFITCSQIKLYITKYLVVFELCQYVNVILAIIIELTLSREQ